jgi:hypothetical protein
MRLEPPVGVPGPGWLREGAVVRVKCGAKEMGRERGQEATIMKLLAQGQGARIQILKSKRVLVTWVGNLESVQVVEHRQ